MQSNKDARAWVHSYNESQYTTNKTTRSKCKVLQSNHRTSMTKSTPPPSPLTNSATSTPRRSPRNLTKVVRGDQRKKKKGTSKKKGSNKKRRSDASDNNAVNKNVAEKRKFVDEKGRSIRMKRPKHHTDSSRGTRTTGGKKKSISSSDEEYTSPSEDDDVSGNEEPVVEATMELIDTDRSGGQGDKGKHTFSRRRFLDDLNQEQDASSDEEGAPTTSDRHTAGALRNVASLPNPSEQNGNVASSLQDMEGFLTIRGMSSKESVQNRQKHIADRMRTFVKSEVFRRIKFINSDLMFQRAFKLAMDHENVPAEKRAKFQMLYESVFNEALNTKRSSCEQSGAKFVEEQVRKMGGAENFYTIEELSKLRRATTEREREATFWFFGTFLQCVSGRIAWGKQCYHQLVSKATETGGQAKVVTTSDEAFALLLFDNYIEKWLAGKQPAETNEPTDPPDDGRRKGFTRKGKYTGKKSGHCKYGGWSREGTARFNYFYNLVQVDRASPVAETMEKEILQYCKAQKFANEGGGDALQPDEGGTNAGLGVLDAMMPVEAYWDLED